MTASVRSWALWRSPCRWVNLAAVPVVLAARLRVVRPAVKSLLADLVVLPVVLPVVRLVDLVVRLRVLHLVVPVVLVVPEALPTATITGTLLISATLPFMPAAR